MRTSTKTLFTFFYKGALSVVSFLVSVLVARWFGSTDAGVADRALFQLAGTYAQTGMTFVGGFTNYYAYAVSKWPDERDQVVQTGNMLVFGASLAVWAASWLVWQFGGGRMGPEWMWALWLTPCMFIFGYGTKLLNALDDVTWLNRLNLVQPLMFLAVLVALWHWRPLDVSIRLHAAFMLWFATYAVTAAWAMVMAYRRLGRRSASAWRWWPRHGRGTLEYGGWSSIAQVVSYANYRMDFWMTALFLGNTVTSVYGIAVVASEVLLNLSGSLSQVVFARMTSASRDDAATLTETASRQTLLSSALVALGMAVVFPVLIRYAYGYRYAPAILPFLILLPGLVFKAASNLVIQYATNSLGQPVTSIWMNGLCALINAALCWALLPLWGMLGAAIASTVSYGVSFYLYTLWYEHVSSRPASELWRIRRDDLAAYTRLARTLLRRGREAA
jgi:O-antigen/teichoic acid export membrane protein